MLLLLQETGYGIPLGIAAIISACIIIASFFVTRSIYKTTLPTRQAQQWQANYEAEKVRADTLANQNTELLKSKATYEKEHGLIALEFSQLSQLFAKKSIILEALTGEYGNLAELAERGELADYLRARKAPVTDDIHRTGGGRTSGITRRKPENE
jgi:hypothetical protein